MSEIVQDPNFLKMAIEKGAIVQIDSRGKLEEYKCNSEQNSIIEKYFDKETCEFRDGIMELLQIITEGNIYDVYVTENHKIGIELDESTVVNNSNIIQLIVDSLRKSLQIEANFDDFTISIYDQNTKSIFESNVKGKLF